MMTNIITCRIAEDTKKILTIRANLHGWSIEEEIRNILQSTVHEESSLQPKLGSSIAAQFIGIGLTEPLPEWHETNSNPMDFGL